MMYFSVGIRHLLIMRKSSTVLDQILDVNVEEDDKRNVSGLISHNLLIVHSELESCRCDEAREHHAALPSKVGLGSDQWHSCWDLVMSCHKHLLAGHLISTFSSNFRATVYQ